MHLEIEKLIEMALADGQVTEREREIILRKAEKLDLDIDEVEMYLEGKISSEQHVSEVQFNNSSQKKPNKDNLDNLEIKDLESYFNKNDLLEWLKYLMSIDDCFKQFNDENILKKTFLDWTLNKFQKQFIFKINFDFFQNLLNTDETIEFNSREYIKKIFENEDFYGYYIRLANRLLEKSEIELLLPQIIKSSYSSYIITNKAIYSFNKKTKIETVKKLFFESERILNSYEEPKRLSYEEIADPYLYSMNNPSNIEIKIFGSKFSSYYKENFSMYDVIKKIHLNFSFDVVNEVIKNSNFENMQLDKLIRIHNFINSEIKKFNDFIENIKENENIKKGAIIYTYNCNLKEFRVGQKNQFGYNSYLLNIIDYIINKISMVANVIISRDLLLNSYLSNDTINQNKIILLLEDSGVFLNKFERDVLDNLESINSSLGQINKTISDGISNLIDSTERINESITISNLSIKELGDKLDGIGMLNLISAYQLYKINIQTKS